MVRHEDFMAPAYLPTFNINSIELNLHRIKGLSQQFVFFNDDMFLINSVVQEDFFKNGFPVTAVLRRHWCRIISEILLQIFL